MSETLGTGRIFFFLLLLFQKRPQSPQALPKQSSSEKTLQRKQASDAVRCMGEFDGATSLSDRIEVVKTVEA